MGLYVYIDVKESKKLHEEAKKGKGVASELKQKCYAETCLDTFLLGGPFANIQSTMTIEWALNQWSMTC